jgi:flagellar export protein FliJ
MKPYRFRLQAVLTLREHAEQDAQRQCASAYAVVEHAVARVSAVEAEIDTAEQAYRAQLTSLPRAGDVEHSQLYALLLHERRCQTGRELAEARRRADDARRRLLLAMQKREALERLRRHQLRVHDTLAARAEQRDLDELSLKSKIQSLKPLGEARQGLGLKTLDSRLQTQDSLDA